jgi:hypothetical protein
VTEICVGNLKLNFGPTKKVLGEEVPVPDHERNGKEALEVAELELKEEQISMLNLEDPLELERQIANGELEEMLDKDEDASTE